MAIVYRHRRLDNHEVFYVGVGSQERRAYSERSRNHIWKGIVNRCGYQVEIVARDLSREDALELEMFMISEYGRIDLGTGKLCNLTEGGDGSWGHKQSKETREKRSKSLTGIKRDEQHREKTSKARKGKGNGMYGKVPYNAQRVFCGYLNKEFDSIKECAEALEISQSFLSAMVRGEKENKFNVTRI
jgi:hypothetical protein